MTLICSKTLGINIDYFRGELYFLTIQKIYQENLVGRPFCLAQHTRMPFKVEGLVEKAQGGLKSKLEKVLS